MARIVLLNDQLRFQKNRRSVYISNLLVYTSIACAALVLGFLLGHDVWPSAMHSRQLCRTVSKSDIASSPAVDVSNFGTDRMHEGHVNSNSDALKLPIPPPKYDKVVVANLEDFRGSLESMQRLYFELWVGNWPDAIDWTGAVMGTLLSASLQSLHWIWSSTNEALSTQHYNLTKQTQLENEINTYFTEMIAYYFGEDAFAIRLQAYDDMLWVVLGWLESIRFITARAHTYGRPVPYPGGDANKNSAWYGEQFVPVFAHRARIFYDLARVGYDYTLCEGGMLWNPGLLPYKNAITNELFITASISMYLYFPGDSNDSPFSDQGGQCLSAPYHCLDHKLKTSPSHEPYDSIYKDNAIEAYDWLKNINMTNEQGLYVDGFHIKNYGVNHTLGTRKCDVRNEMVYTYNQGVLLSGLRGLWEGTGNRSYLVDGHKLVRNVINATGWDLEAHPRIASAPEERRRWRGLGRAGVLEDACDASGTCNQDAQTFKAIFFHHLTLFCEPLPRLPKKPGKTFGADSETLFLHQSSCAGYGAWVDYNARAALNTRDEKGRFGMWWTWGLEDGMVPELRTLSIETLDDRIPNGANDDIEELTQASAYTSRRNYDTQARGRDRQQAMSDDPNDRSRGRTVETQGGGLAVVRAALEFARLNS